MIHRHLQYPPETPVEQLPAAALVDILDRGDLADWRPIAAVIARSPSGAFAQRIRRLVDANPMYGTSPLWRAWMDRCRAREEGSSESMPPMHLRELRRRAGLTQVELAARLGISQSDLSKLERREDLRFSTLAAYVAAVGGTLRLVAEVGGERSSVRLGRAGD